MRPLPYAKGGKNLKNHYIILPKDLVESMIFKIKQAVTNTVPTIKLIKNVES